ncbi:MAG TPA: adenosylmethionine--8-amino-7-oxononanoate transaminase [Pseudolabrys sp.]|nr:adenosylmethionine--8-amino-7-oxononanoate transaminase [Pseudolabrys sp.]
MPGETGKRIDAPAWFTAGLPRVWLPYTQMKIAAQPLPVVRTEGARIVLADGRELIDGIASWWTACHGYNHPYIRQAVERQLAQMPHVMFGGLAHEQALTLAKRLTALLPGDLSRVFFSDSGSVAVEIAMKMAVQFWINRGVRRRTKFVAFKGAYHGDTAGAMAVCDPDEGMHTLFAGLLPQHLIADLPEDDERASLLEGLIERHADSVAGIIVEPLVQGAGGMKFHDAAVLRRLRKLADKYDLLLVFDEIFTGFGRTGALFACEVAGVMPDIITLSKALTGGTLPLAATIATRRVFDAFWSDDPQKALMHGPTFMANALACAAANASLDLFEREPRLRQVQEISIALAEGLAPCRGLPGVKDARIKGAIGVVEMARIADLDRLRARFLEENVFIRPFDNIIYLTPAFTIEPDDLATLTNAIVKVVRDGVG